ncbi:MAG: hypothetical protein KUG77_26665 [Nannocystaceae bacterium]|nr:hypothetical protein [Nannocystaceae bacterium]
MRRLSAMLIALAGCSRPVAPAQPHAAPDGGSAAASVQAVLEGDRGRFEEAVAQLYARRSEPDTAAVLARLLNLPLSEGDPRYAPLQRSLYEGLAAGPHASERDATIARGFLLASAAAEQYQQGKSLRALATLRRLERDLETELERTDDVELHAMLGNYAHQAGGLVPLRRPHRFGLARKHLEQVVTRFDELSPESQGISLGLPGVRPVFAMWRAELLRRDGDPGAGAAYAVVLEAVKQADDTPALRTLADVARRHASGSGPTDTAAPLWPHGYTACVTCHAP